MKQMSGEEHSWRETAHAKALRQHQAWGTPKGKDVSGEQSQSRAEQRVKGKGQITGSNANPLWASGFHSECDRKSSQQGRPRTDGQCFLQITVDCVENRF